MNLQQYALKHGMERLWALSILCGIKVGYMKNLLYTVNSGHKTPKTPSIKLAQKFTTATFGELSMEGLANPTEFPRKKETPRVKAGAIENGVNELLGND